MLKQHVKDDLKNSMLARDEAKTSVLRMLLSSIGYYEIQKGGAGYEATDEDVLAVIQKEAKQRTDAIEQFTNANRTELVEKETKEKEILQAYLPEQMDESELRGIIETTIQEIGAKDSSEMGKVMGAIMPKVKGRADGGKINKIVRELLQS